MSNRLIRSMSAVVLSTVPLSIALSAAPAQAVPHTPAAPARSAQSAALAQCSVTRVIATTRPISHSTTVVVDAVCDATGWANVTVKVEGVTRIMTHHFYLANVPRRFQENLPESIPVGSEVCVEVNGAQGCDITG
ncbi:hypothetical protein [Streptomyces sp. NPDC001970]